MNSQHRNSRTTSTSVLLMTAGALGLAALGTVWVREYLYSTVAEAVAGSPELRTLVGTIASRGLLILVAVTAVVAVRSWRQDRTAFWRLATGGIGVVVAYSLSEAVKLAVTEERPCRTRLIDTALACPEAGDWSWPSNHSVLAAAFATACIIALPRIAWLVAPVAVIIAVSRVAAGVHYVHDVASGLALGIVLVVLITATLSPTVARVGDSLPAGRNTTGRPRF